jgi:hypothetical protein
MYTKCVLYVMLLLDGNMGAVATRHDTGGIASFSFCAPGMYTKHVPILFLDSCSFFLNKFLPYTPSFCRLTLVRVF